MEGNVATAPVIWTGVMNEGVGKAPGRRFISSDSGRPDRFDATWKPRAHR